MRITKETELNAIIKSDGIQGVYLLCGKEEFLINNWKNVLIKDYANEVFNFVKLDGSVLDLTDLYDCTQQLPMFSDKRCVLLDGLDPKKLLKDTLDSLATIFSDNPPSTILIITAIGMDTKSAAAKKIISLVDKHGTVVEFAPRTNTSLVGYIQSIFKSNNSTISSDLAKEIIRLCGSDMQKLSVESEKLSSYTYGRDATKEDISLVIIPTVEERVFDLSKFIFAGNANRALELTGNLLDQKESPVMIISTLIMSYVDLYRAKAAQSRGVSATELGKVLAYGGRQFRLGNAYNTRISLSSVEKSLDLLYNTDKLLKSSSIEDNLLLEKTVLELIYLKES